jgi:hypothetical protein
MIGPLRCKGFLRGWAKAGKVCSPRLTGGRRRCQLKTYRIVNRLTICDARYLELSQRRDLPFAPLDQELRGAGHALGLPFLGS